MQNPTLIHIGKEEVVSLQVDDADLLKSLSRLKANYEKMESQLDAGYSCKIGDEDKEYALTSDGFKSYAKDMKAYYDGLMKAVKDEMKDVKSSCDEKYSELKVAKDAVDAELKIIKEEVSNRDGMDEVVRKKAKELSTLIDFACDVLGCNPDDLWEKDEYEIKKMVIAKCYPNLPLDGETQGSIDAMFKTCKFYQKDSKSVVLEQKQIANTIVRPEFTKDNAISARQQVLTESWKKSIGGEK